MFCQKLIALLDICLIFSQATWLQHLVMTYQGESRSDEFPTVLEVREDGATKHHGNVVIEPVCPVHPTNHHALAEADGQQNDATGRVRVEDLEYVHSSLGKEQRMYQVVGVVWCDQTGVLRNSLHSYHENDQKDSLNEYWYTYRIFLLSVSMLQSRARPPQSSHLHNHGTAESHVHQAKSPHQHLTATTHTKVIREQVHDGCHDTLHLQMEIENVHLHYYGSDWWEGWSLATQFLDIEYIKVFSHDQKSCIGYTKVRNFSESSESADITETRMTIGRDCTKTVAAAGTDLDELGVEPNHQNHAEEES